jgi:hypothetical protein
MELNRKYQLKEMTDMKAWLNEKGNWCFEFEQDEKETERLIFLVGAGAGTWEPTRTKYRDSYISARLFDACLATIFIGQNYSQSKPTIEKPIKITSKQCALDAIESAKEMSGWNAESFTQEELDYIKEKLKRGGLDL